MKIISFRRPDGTPSFGRVDGDTIVDLGGRHADLKAAITAGDLSAQADGERFDMAGIVLLPVIPNPGKILCVGHNYESHRQETGRAKVDNPSIFTRFADTLIAAGQPIVRPHVSDRPRLRG